MLKPVKMEMREVQFAVGGMHCASCVGNVERLIRNISGVEEVAVSLLNQTAVVRFAEPATFGEMVSVLEKAGYSVSRLLKGMSESPDTSDEEQRARRVFLQSAALAVPIVVCEMGPHFSDTLHGVWMEVRWLPWILLAFSTGIQVFPGRQFYRLGWAAFRRGVPDMNSLVCLGVGAAYVHAWLGVLMPRSGSGWGGGYGETSGVVVTLVLMGRWMEAVARGKAGRSVGGLMALQPKTARIRQDGMTRDIPVGELQVGDEFVVRPGERIPADGQILEGRTSVDRSLVTGESEPVWCGIGEKVLGGTLNGTGSLICRATEVGAATVLAQIVELVRRAQETKLPVQAAVDRVTAYFVPMVLCIAVVTLLGWMFLVPGAGFGTAWLHAVSVLIIACPCAMGLAVPTSVLVATGRAAELGVLFRTGEALQSLAGIQTLLLDKTGTLTKGQFQLERLCPASGSDEKLVLQCAASVEFYSEHPIGGALVKAAAERGVKLEPVTEFESVTGQGVRAVWGGDRFCGEVVRVGNAKFLRDAGILVSGVLTARFTQVHVALGRIYLGMLELGDEIRAPSIAAVHRLLDLGIRVVMVTGDRRETAAAVAERVGIREVRSDMAPKDKMREVHAFREFGTVGFVGDGLNDAPAMAAADVGVAIGGGTDVALESAGVVLVGGDLGRLPDAVRLSRATVRNLRMNLLWAFGYNLLLIPVAAGVFESVWGLRLTPELAGLAMAFSSVSVVANSLRLRRFR